MRISCWCNFVDITCSIEGAWFTHPGHLPPALPKGTTTAGPVNIGTNHIAASAPPSHLQVTVTSPLVCKKLKSIYIDRGIILIS